MIPLHKRRLISLPPARKSDRVLLRIDTAKIGIFRFLLEAYEHAALFSVLEKGQGQSPAVLKCLFSPHQRAEVLGILKDIQKSVSFSMEPWPFAAHPPEVVAAKPRPALLLKAAPAPEQA